MWKRASFMVSGEEKGKAKVRSADERKCLTGGSTGRSGGKKRHQTPLEDVLGGS